MHLFCENCLLEEGTEGTSTGKMTVRSDGQESVKAPRSGKKRVGVILSNACHSSVVKFYSGRATNGRRDGVANQEFVTRNRF